MKLGIVCQSCGLEAPTRHVVFHRNVGKLFTRAHRKLDANVCKRCLHEKFWTCTAVTVAVGWCGITSIVMAPCYVINNLIRYFGALPMPSVPPGARQPQINEEVFSRFLHRSEEVFQRVHAGENPDDIARDLGGQIGATPGQVLKCMITMVQHQQMQHDLQERNRANSPEARRDIPLEMPQMM
jgi:hypothetical protein